jgi:4-diphosphocytidyl-2-C-methyl-D-erythritol kinase
MIAPNTLVLEAPAKINVFLRVLGRRGDGFHDIETLVVPISLADRLRVHAHADPTEFRTLSVSLAVTGDGDLVRHVPADESNLVVRAATALAQRATVRGFADFELEKRIPVAAGLGGGSSDAAAALTALNDLWGCALERSVLREIAARIGSDVPAMLEGGPVLVTGRGEHVEPHPPVALDLILVPFDFGIKTADAYRWWDEDGGPKSPDGPHPNDLEEPVMRRHPRIRDAKELLLQGGATTAFMCGSGPTVAGVLSGGRLGDSAERSLEAVSGRRPIHTSTSKS